MSRKTVSVAYEDPRFSKKEAAYWSQVRSALDSMGAPNSGELLHNSKAYVEGVYKAGLPALETAAVIWHKHCQGAGTSSVPCVAEDREPLVAVDPWVLLEPGFWEWRTAKYPPGGYAIAQLPRKKGFELGRWDSTVGRVSFRAIAVYPSLESAQAGAAVYAMQPGGMEAGEISLTEKRVPGSWYLERRKNGKLISLYGPWHSEAAAMGGRRSLETVRRTNDGSVLTLPLLAVGVVPGVQECPCETEESEAACPSEPTAAMATRRTVKAEREWEASIKRAPHNLSKQERRELEQDLRALRPDLFPQGEHSKMMIIGTEVKADGYGYNVMGSIDSLTDDALWSWVRWNEGYAPEGYTPRGERVVPVISEANDSAPSCVPFTRLERNNEAFQACQRIAKGPLESDRDMFRLLSSQLGKEDQEVFVVVGLDLHRNLRSYTEIARGQRDRVSVNVEDVVRAVIADGPHGFVVAHNHPSGKANPSPKDKELTDRIQKAAAIACPSVVFLDHIVVGQGEYYCFADGKLKHAR